jgi:hypothetical protein
VTAKKKKKIVSKRRKPVNAVLLTDQPVRIKTVTSSPAPPGAKKISLVEVMASVRQSLFYGFWIGVGLAPIGFHIGSQFYCGHGENMRCQPIEFPAWMEAGGIIIALIFANAAKDVVSKSAKQLADAAKGWLIWRNGKQDSTPPTG